MVYGLVYDPSLGLLHVHVACRGSYGPSPQRLSVIHTGRSQIMCWLLADESDGLVRALQSLSGAFSGRGASATPPLGGIVYRPDLRLAVRNCKPS